MARTYRLFFENVLVAAAQDLFQVIGVTGKMVRIKRHALCESTTSLATMQGLRLRARVLPSTVTIGSGGTTGITPSKADPGDAASTATTCATNNTTPASTSGTALIVYTNGCVTYQGDTWRYDDMPPVGPTSAFVLELLSTPTGTLRMDGVLEFEEIG